uniref:Integrase catalytic domain-containing protein n=1 Tax=Trichogramma kaykai TaxID=54128 RepID=A0ABD2W5D2_9HYME
MYMDDVLSGAWDVGLVKQKRDQLSVLFASGGFSLAKWMNNDSDLLSTFSSESLAKEATLKVGLGFSVLGLVWEPRKDVFHFNVSFQPLASPVTKRKSLWLLTKEWDVTLPADEVEKWRAFEDDLKGLTSLVIPRWNGVMSEALIELHGFADASKFAYAAVLYVRVIYQGRVRVNLLASKTKVAPLKTQSIPRLELCAAHLLAKLVASFASTEDFVSAKIHLWSDSKTTLHWIHGIPARWPVFVANRFADKSNVALTLRFKAATENRISVDELSQATLQACRMTQSALLAEEIRSVSLSLRNLCPVFVDGLLRVGGRLDNAHISDDCKHQVILPAKCRLVELLIDHLHKRTLHGGTRLVITHLRQSFWIPRVTRVVGTHLRKCIVCLRYRAATTSQPMADLPAVRVTPSRLFESSGVDYAGPFRLKASNHRGNLSYKGYMAIFVCMATKAVNLEAVSSYDTASFIAAFRRFTSRRGPCLHLYSDRGTNFVGADAELRRMHNKGSEFYDSIFTQLRDQQGTTWHYNPPGSPHFGGLWESGVKSVKHHLKRMIGDSLLTYEEFATLLAQIEAVLNSRPLTPPAESLEPESVLTPAYLIIGAPSFIINEPPIKSENLSTLERWQRITLLTQEFWERWSKEYLLTLQKRGK